MTAPHVLAGEVVAAWEQGRSLDEYAYRMTGRRELVAAIALAIHNARLDGALVVQARGEG